MQTSMMSQLLSMPLFQGLTMDELMKLLEQVRPDFLHFEDAYIQRSGERHNRLLYILRGNVVRELSGPGGRFLFTEVLDESTFIEISSLFGRDTSLRASYRAVGEAVLLAFDKSYMFNVFGHFSIVQLNILNLYCAYSQSLLERQSMPIGDEIHTLFCHFIRSLCENPRGEKQLKMTRNDLALQLGCNRRRMSELIVSWQKAGLVDLSYSQISIPDLIRLQNYRPTHENASL
ncbi:MAG: Crp/Fnr family transcriptional regulator [Bacteroidaceae bacterium]|nr:Crp/Fnr family transcriptional regulator [Bacteroidaceae bacterium]